MASPRMENHNRPIDITPPVSYRSPILIPSHPDEMELRWLIISILFTSPLANATITKRWGYEWNSSHPYWNEAIKPCADAWLPMCDEHIEGRATVPILCECGQDRLIGNDLLISFAQCIAQETPESSERAFQALQLDCSKEGLFSTGAIAGIAVGAIAAGAAVIGLLVWLWLQRRTKNGDKLESNPPSSPKPENLWAAEFKPEWTANAPVELPPTNYAAAGLPPESAPIYEMDAMPTKPVEMPGSIPDTRKEEKKEKPVDQEGQEV
ncbi:hypothetical protein NXS19_004716 [Fusarium pseudograminearum]|nr:hypothetical protein NXS19_004716 [Fusarium pseudograminearum]